MFYKSFIITGDPNKTIYDTGLISTVAEPLQILAVLVSVDKYNDNIIEGWIETSRILQIPDRLVDTHDKAGAADAYQSTSKISRIPVDEPIPPGMIFKMAINSGAVASVLTGCYEYRHTT